MFTVIALEEIQAIRCTEDGVSLHLRGKEKPIVVYQDDEMYTVYYKHFEKQKNKLLAKG